MFFWVKLSSLDVEFNFAESSNFKFCINFKILKFFWLKFNFHHLPFLFNSKSTLWELTTEDFNSISLFFDSLMLLTLSRMSWNGIAKGRPSNQVFTSPPQVFVFKLRHVGRFFYEQLEDFITKITWMFNMHDVVA